MRSIVKISSKLLISRKYIFYVFVFIFYRLDTGLNEMQVMRSLCNCDW